jgi:hypothetical protein
MVIVIMRGAQGSRDQNQAFMSVWGDCLYVMLVIHWDHYQVSVTPPSPQFRILMIIANGLVFILNKECGTGTPVFCHATMNMSVDQGSNAREAANNNMIHG